MSDARPPREKYGPAIVTIDVRGSHYTICPDLGSSCWVIEHRKVGRKKIYRYYYARLSQAVVRLRDLALQDTSPDLDGADIVNAAVRGIAVAIRGAGEDLLDDSSRRAFFPSKRSEKPLTQ